MKEWLTARELAGARLPGMPATERSLQRLADREGWNDHPAFVRQRQGRGGGLEYHFRILPTLAQMAYAERNLEVGRALPAETAAPALSGHNDLSGRARLERDARLAIVQAFERFTRGLEGLNHASHLQIFTDRYRTGRITVEDWVKETVPSFSKRSLDRWRSEARNGRADRLATDRGEARRGTGLLDTANGGKVKAYILALIAHQPFLTAAHVRTQCRAEFGDSLTVERKGETVTKPMPPERTFQHFLKGLKQTHKAELLKLTNPDQYRSTVRVAGNNSLAHIQRGNQLWQIDASPVDALCIDRRHSIYACVDIATRRAIFLISETPRAAAVALLMRKAILAWGVPETVKTDNGSDFVARDTQRLLAALAIELEVSDAYSPQQKGHVERLIRTFQHDCATLLPGFVGHSVADRKQIESRKSFAERLGESEAETFGVQLTGAELQKRVDAWANSIYLHRPHKGLKNETPFNAATRLATDIRHVDERALDVLLMPVAGRDGVRTVTKLGVRIEGHHYATLNVLPGEQVMVRQDPADKGRVLLFSPDGSRYLDEAICPELIGVDPKALVAARRAKQTEMMDEATRQVKATMREIVKGPSLIDRALDVASRDVPNVLAFRKPGETHSTPALDAARQVGQAGADNAKAGDEEALAEAQARLIADMNGGDPMAPMHRAEQERARQVEANRQARANDNVTVLPETALDRYRRAVAIAEAVEAGTANPADAVWLGSYSTTPEFKAHAAMHEDFGDAYLRR